MDNKAFSTLVQDRAKAKSTKEIAREAVEEEFRTRNKKRKRRGGGGGGSTSEEESDDEKESDEDDAVRQDSSLPDNLLIPAAARKKKGKEESSKYRDRAKERRQGKDADYSAHASLLEGIATAANNEGDMDQVTLSKYLGGDEEHTHLVKGLDVALARKLKRELVEMTRKDDDPQFPSAVKRQEEANELAQNVDEAKLFLQRALVGPKSGLRSSELGHQMLDYLQNVHIPLPSLSQVNITTVSPAGFAIQHSTLTFATVGDPRDRNRAWEAPLERSTQAVSSRGTMETINARQSCSALDRNLMVQIKNVLKKAQPSCQHKTTKRQTPVEDREKEGKRPKADTISSGTKVDDDPEDDIFDDSDDYVPPTLIESTRQVPTPGNDGSNVTSTQRVSVFSNLGASATIDPFHDNRNAVAVVQSMQKTTQDVMSRDILGSGVDVPATRNPAVGISVSSYDGGYGEEMDIDFDGGCAAEDDRRAGKKRAQEETTVVSNEYRRRRGKFK